MDAQVKDKIKTDWDIPDQELDLIFKDLVKSGFPFEYDQRGLIVYNNDLRRLFKKLKALWDIYGYDRTFIEEVARTFKENISKRQKDIEAMADYVAFTVITQLQAARKLVAFQDSEQPVTSEMKNTSIK